MSRNVERLLHIVRILYAFFWVVVALGQVVTAILFPSPTQWPMLIAWIAFGLHLLIDTDSETPWIQADRFAFEVTVERLQDGEISIFRFFHSYWDTYRWHINRSQHPEQYLIEDSQ